MGQSEVGGPGAGSPELLGYHQTPDQMSITDESLLGVSHLELASGLLCARPCTPECSCLIHLFGAIHGDAGPWRVFVHEAIFLLVS